VNGPGFLVGFWQQLFYTCAASLFRLHDTEPKNWNQAQWCNAVDLNLYNGARMGFNGFVAVGVGAMFGAWLRWGLGLMFNDIHPTIPLGTLAANLIGGYLVGVATMLSAGNEGISPEMRLFIITGFLGGLTTFSAFSAEAVGMLTRAQYSWAFLHMLSHLFGSVALTAIGFFTAQAIRQQL
jgi:CrcB protein